jgi:HEAT repeat protein
MSALPCSGPVLFVLALALPARVLPESLDELIGRILAVADEGDGITPEEQELATQIEAYGAEAIPRMLPFLESPREAVRDFAGYTVRDLDGLTEEHLDALIRARRGGNGWIPGAIGRVGTPRAIAFLVDDLKADPESGNQVTGALESAGEKAALALAASFRDPAPLSLEYVRCVRDLFHELEVRAAPAIDPLLEIAADEGSDAAHRRAAVEAIGSIGPAARRSIPALRGLAASAPGIFAAAVDDALVGIGGPEAVPILLARLEADPSTSAVWEIAALGENGRDAGPALVELIGSKDRDIRVEAARAVGLVGYAGAADELLRALGDADDWKLALVAAGSLYRLRATSAVPALEAVAANHWYVRVREGAAKALGVLRGSGELSEESSRRETEFRLFEPDCGDRTTPGELPHLAAEPYRIADDVLPTMSYEADFRFYDEDGEHVVRRTRVPSCGLRVEGGFLLGDDRGEWGGELVLERPGKPAIPVLTENTVGVHRAPFGLVAVTGLNHLLSNGVLYRIERGPGGSYRAEWWKRLPGAPEQSGLLEDGSLFVRCDGGDVVVTREGRIRAAETR